MADLVGVVNSKEFQDTFAIDLHWTKTHGVGCIEYTALDGKYRVSIENGDDIDYKVECYLQARMSNGRWLTLAYGESNTSELCHMAALIEFRRRYGGTDIDEIQYYGYMYINKFYKGKSSEQVHVRIINTNQTGALVETVMEPFRQKAITYAELQDILLNTHSMYFTNLSEIRQLFKLRK